MEVKLGVYQDMSSGIGARGTGLGDGEGRVLHRDRTRGWKEVQFLKCAEDEK